MTAKPNMESLGLHDHEIRSLIIYQLDRVLEFTNNHNEYRDIQSEHNLIEARDRLNTLIDKFVTVTRRT